MTEAVVTTAATGGDAAPNPEGTNFDGTPLETTSAATTDTSAKPETKPSGTEEELFEVQVGKDSKGQPVIKKFNKADLIKHAGMGVSAHERFESVKQERAKLEALAKAMKDPEKFWEIAAGLGHNTEELLQKRVEKILADASLSPEQKQARLEKEELERYRREDAARQKAQQEADVKAANEKYSALITTKIQEGLKAAKMADTPENRAAIVGILSPVWDEMVKANPNARFEDVPMDKVIANVKTSRVGGIKELLEGADEDTILATLPEDVLNKIAKAITKKYQGSQKSVDNTVSNAPAEPSKPAKRKSFSELQAEAEARVEQLEKLRKGTAR